MEFHPFSKLHSSKGSQIPELIRYLLRIFSWLWYTIQVILVMLSFLFINLLSFLSNIQFLPLEFVSFIFVFIQIAQIKLHPFLFAERQLLDLFATSFVIFI